MAFYFGKNKTINCILIFTLLFSIIFGLWNPNNVSAVPKKIVPFANFPINATISANESRSFDLAFKTGGMLTVLLKSQISNGKSLQIILTTSGQVQNELFSSYSIINSKVGFEIKDVSNFSTLKIIGNSFTTPVDIQINYEPYFVQFLMLRAKVWVNGYPEDLDVAPYFIEKNEMLPLRYVTQSLGAKVDWKEKTKSATIFFYNKTMKFEIGNKVININGVNKSIPVAPEIKNGRIYLPLYVLLNILNLDCNYNKDIGIIFLGGRL